MGSWNPEEYLKFKLERTRPAEELLNRVQLTKVGHAVDLGCGPGNSTEILRRRWPRAKILGVDRSEAMIAKARDSFPREAWVVADLADFQPPWLCDLVFANAALHWLKDHHLLIPSWMQKIRPGGALAFQIPSSEIPLVRKAIEAVSRDSRWSDRMEEARSALTLHPAPVYYQLLDPLASQLDLWETRYYHSMPNHQAILDWMGSTGLRPYLDALSDSRDQQQFLDEVLKRVQADYPIQPDGTVVFPFQRLFVVAYRC